jgi:hypothetical protein
LAGRAACPEAALPTLWSGIVLPDEEALQRSALCALSAARPSRMVFGDPLALRPCLATGLPLSGAEETQTLQRGYAAPIRCVMLLVVLEWMRHNYAFRAFECIVRN